MGNYALKPPQTSTQKNKKNKNLSCESPAEAEEVFPPVMAPSPQACAGCQH